jgi:hypothetical protein
MWVGPTKVHEPNMSDMTMATSTIPVTTIGVSCITHREINSLLFQSEIYLLIHRAHVSLQAYPK